MNHTVFDASASGAYDANGNLVTSVDALGVTQTRSYDGLNRYSGLQSSATVNGSTVVSSTSYTYDVLDNLTQTLTPDYKYTTSAYDGLSNRKTLTSPDTGTTSSTFDIAGNVLTRTDAKNIVATSSYDALSRLLATTYVDTTLNVAYHYDEANSVTGCVGSYPVGRLTRIVEASVTTVYCYDARGNVTQKSQTQGSTTDVTAYSYTSADRLARAIANGAGITIWQWPYQSNPWGEASPTSAGGYVFNLRFPGQYYDAESKLAYNISRNYEPATGRYIQSDPIGLRGGISTYLYANGSPMMVVDPLGQSGFCRAALTVVGSICGGYIGRQAGMSLAAAAGAVGGTSVGPEGTIGGGATGLAVGGIAGGALGSTAGGIAGNALANKMCNGSADDSEAREKVCEERLEIDLATCAALGKRDGGSAYKICEGQAMIRYAACLRGIQTDAPLPPWGTK